jgi:hypothetical protein
MIVYWTLFFVIILIQLIPISTYKVDKLKLLISFLLIFIYSAIRLNFGRDYDAYENIFNDIQNASNIFDLETRIEFGYVWLNKIVSSYRALLVILSLFTCFTYYWLFRRFIPVKYYWLGFTLMSICGDNMLFFQLSGLRNAIAINIMTLSLPLIIKRKILLYAGMTVIAYFFHNTVALFMPLAYFIATPYKFKWIDIVIWILIIILFLTLSSTFLIDLIAPYIDIYFVKYVYYIDIAYDQVHEKSVLLYGFVIFMFLMSFIILRRKNLSENDNIILKLSLLFVVSLTLGVLNFRMSQYFAPFLVVGTTIVMDKVKIPFLRFAYLSVVLIFLYYSFFVVYMGGEYFPYDKYFTIFD